MAPKTNNKIIGQIQTDIHWIKKELKTIKNQIFNHLPAQMESLEDSFNEYKLSNSKWLVGILISILLLLLATLFNVIVK